MFSNLKMFRRRTGLKTASPQEIKLFSKSFRGEEITDGEVIDAIRSMPCHYANVGPILSADGVGSASLPRVDRQGAAVICEAHGRYNEAVSRGNVCIASEQGSGVTVQATLTTTSILNLYNPSTSFYDLSILRVACVYTSGTLGTGVLYHCANYAATATTPSGGTALTARSAYVGGGVGSLANVRVAVGDTVVAPVAVFPFLYLPPELATTVTAPQFDEDNMEGILRIAPGYQYQIGAVAAAGTSPKMSPGIVWEEIYRN